MKERDDLDLKRVFCGDGRCRCRGCRYHCLLKEEEGHDREESGLFKRRRAVVVVVVIIIGVYIRCCGYAVVASLMNKTSLKSGGALFSNTRHVII